MLDTSNLKPLVLSELKECSRCGDMFFKKNRKTCGLVTYCKACRKFLNKKYRKKSKLKWNATERLKHKLDPRLELLKCAKYRAKRDGISFGLCLEDIIIPAHCPILGMTLQTGNGKATEASPTIDRTNSALGYTKENVAVISWRANRIKSDASIEELTKIAEYMKGKNA